jgi:predicted nucleic acid-binding protein
MHVLFDTNVVLDVLLNREPWVDNSSTAWQANDDGHIIGYITACVLTDIFYIAHRLTTLEKARTAVRICLEAFEVCTVDLSALKLAEILPGSDFEDNLQIACASRANLDAILTRDKAGFQDAVVSVITPAELLAEINE